MMMKRRDALLTGLFGTGHVGLKALATGLPAWFIARPHTATAQSLECALEGREKLQYLIVSASDMGDPINCNCPGTYEVADIIHPTQAGMAQTTVRLGAKSYGAALPWASVDQGGKLAQPVLDRTAFFHHVTRSTTHGDQAKVMKLLGATNRGEMVVSAYAKYLAQCFGTVQQEPVALGARGNASELLSFSGRTLPAISPRQLQQLLTGSRTDPLVRMRTIRDNALNRLNDLAKQDGTNVQKKFLDAMANSQTQVRKLVADLSGVLGAITADDVRGQALAAAALLSANVTPVVTVHIPFGGDNHEDQSLQTEVDQHTDVNGNGSGVAGIQAVMDALAMLGLTDKVTFATINVFGRNLNGISKTMNRAGRDHYGQHSVQVMIGKNVAPGVIGGVMKGGSSGAYGAADISSDTGAGGAGGDIPVAQTHVAAAKTLGAVLGIPQATIDASFVPGAGGKVVGAAVL